MHAGWLASLWVTVPASAPISWPWFVVYLALECGRAWVMLTLGRYWTTRIIHLPGAPLVRSGPYRFLRHPNYVVVCGEIAVLPLVFGQWQIALVFSILNAARAGAGGSRSRMPRWRRGPAAPVSSWPASSRRWPTP